MTPVLFPQDLTGFDPQKASVDFTVGETNTFYVAMAFPATGCADNACPSLINVQQVKDGKVQWRRVWKTEEPVKLRQITANKGEVILLTNSGSANPDSIQAQSQLTWVSDAGDVFLRARVPLELWRRDWAKGTPEQQYAVIPNLKYIQSDDSGKLLLSNQNVIMTGTFSEGISNIYLLDEANSPIDRGDFSDVKFNGEYVYAAGTTRTNLGNPDPTGGNAKLFFLPLDFQLNER
ncbi:MAG: hypothetical protein Q4C67_07565 [Deinococcus sp.]|nr:hypothetical protein [Deinococcus sp.]